MDKYLQYNCRKVRPVEGETAAPITSSQPYNRYRVPLRTFSAQFHSTEAVVRVTSHKMFNQLSLQQ